MTNRAHAAVMPALLFLLIVPGASPGAAQELGAYIVDGRSANAELTRAKGFGGSFVFPATPWLQIRVGVDTREGTAEREGLTCPGVAIRVGCNRVETIESETRMDAFTLAVMALWQPIGQVRVSAGVGPTVAQMRHEATGVSGRPALIRNPRSGHPGVAMVAELFVQPLPIIPLAATAAWQLRRLVLDGCVSTDEHQPFCGAETFTGFQLGGSIVLH